MVATIKENGRLKLTNIGGMKPANAETENVRIITKTKGVYEGTCQLVNASSHVNGEYDKTERTWDTVEVVIYERISVKKIPLNWGSGQEIMRALSLEPESHLLVTSRAVSWMISCLRQFSSGIRKIFEGRRCRYRTAYLCSFYHV